MCTYSTALLLDIILSVHAYSHFKFLYKSMLIRKVIKIHPQTCKKCITLITCHPVNILNRMQISILKGKIFDSQPLSYIRLEQQSEFPPFKEHKIQGLFQDFQGPSYAYLRTEMCQLLQHLSPLPARSAGGGPKAVISTGV